MLERGLDAKAEDEEVAGRVVEKKEARGIGSHLLGRADSDPTWSVDLACHASKNGLSAAKCVVSFLKMLSEKVTFIIMVER